MGQIRLLDREINANGGGQKYFIYGPTGLLAMVDAATSETYVYHFDGTGHTVAMTNSAGEIINRYAYSPYGVLLREEETVPQPFTYAGQVGVYTEASNMYYMRARYYNAELTQFISEDPAGFIDGTNLYAYVGGDPIGYVDPTGEAANLVTGLIGGVTGAVVGGAKNLIQQYATDQDFQPVSFLADVVAGGVGGGCLGATGNVYACSTLSIQISLAGTVGQSALDSAIDNRFNNKAPAINDVQSLSKHVGLPVSSSGK